MIGKLTSSIARTFALALTICATGGASAAVKPLAVWNRDFADRGGFTFDLNGNTANADGTITIKTGSGDGAASGGLQFMRSAYVDTRETPLVAIVGLSNVSMPALGSTSYVLATSKAKYSKNGSESDNVNRTGIQLYNKTNKTNRFIGLWLSNGEYDWYADVAGYYSDASAITSGSHVFAYMYNSAGTYGYLDGTQKYGVSGLKSSDDIGVYGFSIGGLTDVAARQLVGAQISSLVILQTSDVNEIKRWNFLKDLTGASASFANATTTSGVNFSTDETINTAITPAAVFVQTGSPTLTVQDGGSITIGGGTGMLYVADGASLNIDASAIPLSDSNPTYTIISGAIMGTVSVTALPTAPEGYTAVACVTDVGVAVALQKEVSITSPFDGTTLAPPTMATIRNSDAAEVAFGNDMGYWQTVDGKYAVVAKVTGGTYTKVNGYLNKSETPVISGSVAKYLVMSGGTANYVKGVQEAHYDLSTANQIQTTGDAILQLEGSASVKFAFGAGDKGGFTGAANNKTSQAQVTGSTGVTIKGGAVVSGSIVGGWGSAHTARATVTSNTAVRVENVQSTTTTDLVYDSIPAGWIIGGSTYQANVAASSTAISGNSSVCVNLDSGATGEFVKSIIGGSMLPDVVQADNIGQTQSVAGNSSVNIVAPSTVTFSGNIIGGGYSGRGSTGGSSTVGASASVTLTGGTYTNLIVAGGYAPHDGKATVGTTATLTLNEGTVISNGAILDGGNATGLRTLVVNDDFVFTNVTVRNFDVIQVADNKTLTLQAGHEEDAAITLGAGAKLRIAVASEDIYLYEGHVTYCTITTGEGATLEYGFMENGAYEKIDDTDVISGNNLLPYYQRFIVSNGTAGGNVGTAANWRNNAVPTDRNAAFYVDNAEGITVTVDTDITFGDIQVYGSGIVTFVGTGGHKLSCSNLDIASGVTVKIGGTSDSEALNVSNGKISGDGSLEILSGAKMVLSHVVCKNALTVNGKLTTSGATELSSAENVFAASSFFKIENGTTKVNVKKLDTYHGQFLGKVEIAATGTLESLTSDMFEYDATEETATTWDIYGVLSMGNYRSPVGTYNIINLYAGSRVTGAGDGYGALDWLRDGTTLNVMGNATIESPISVRTAGHTVTFNIHDGATLTLTGGFVSSQGSVQKTGNGTLKLQNVAMTVPISGSEGTLELAIVDGEHLTHTAESSFSGVLRTTRNNNKYHVFGTATQGTAGSDQLLTGSPTTIIDGAIILNVQMLGCYLPVKNLSGGEDIYAASNTGAGFRNIKTLQTEDTRYTGVFVAENTNRAARDPGLLIYGQGSTGVHSLELTKTSTTWAPLTIDAYGKVIFSGSGSWLNGATTVKENGVIESQRNAKVAGTVTLESGATVSIVKVDGKLVPFTATTVNLPATGVTVDISALGLTSASGATAIMACGVNDADYVENLSVTGYVGGGTFSYDSTNSQILFTPTPMGEWTFGSGTWSSSSLTDGATHTITYHENISDVTFGAIPTSPATITLDGTRTPASVTFNGGADTTYVIAGGSFEPVGTVTISSGTVKIDTDATLSTVTGSGTLEIGAGRTVTLTSNIALDGIASLTGSGTLVLPAGAAPSTSGMTTLLSNANWQGTVVVSEYNGGTGTVLPIASWGNSGSKVKFIGVSGKLNGDYRTSNGGPAELILENGTGDYAYGLKITASPSDMVRFTKLSGDGALLEATGTSWQTVVEFENAADFSGSIDQTADGGRIYISNIDSGLLPGRGLIVVGTNYSIKMADGNHWVSGNGEQRGGVQIQGTVELLGQATMTAGGNEGVTLHGGATLQFNNIGTSESPKLLAIGGSSAFTFSSGTVTIAFGDGATLRNGAQLIDWSAAELSEPPAGTFQISDANSEAKANYVLVKTSSGLFLTSDVASVNGTTYATLQAAIDAAADSATVTLIRNSNESVELNAKQITFVENLGAIFTGSFSGTGTLVLDGAGLKSPASARWDAGWTGTVWLKNLSSYTLVPGNYGNADSVIKFTGVTAIIASGETFGPAVELEDGGATKALTLDCTTAYLENTVTFNEIRGTGTLVTSSSNIQYPRTNFKVLAWSDFAGSLDVDRGRVIFGTDTPSDDNWRYVYVSSGAAVDVASGKTWKATEGFIVNGSLTCDGGELHGVAGESPTLKLGGSGVVTNAFEGGGAQCFNAGAITVSDSLSVVLLGHWSNFGTWTLNGTSSLGFDPGTDNDILLDSIITSAGQNTTVHIYGNGVNKVVDNAQDGTKDAKIHVHNGGTFQVSNAAADNDRLMYDEPGNVGGITVDAGGLIVFKSRETYTRNTTLNGGTFRLDGVHSDRSLDLFKTVEFTVTDNSTIEATGTEYWIYLRGGTPTFNVSADKTLTMNAGFTYAEESKQNMIKAGAGTMVVNGYVDGGGVHESFSQPKGVTINAGTYELNAVQTSNGQTGDAANFYTVASGAKLKVGATGQVNTTTLTLNDGSLLEFGASSTLINATTVSFASGTTTVSFSSGVTPTVGAKLISWTGKPAGAFSLAAPLAASYALVSDATGLSIASGVAVVNGTTAYATLQAAIDASGDSDVISLLGNNTESITVALGRTLKIAKGSYSCNDPATDDGWPTLYSDPDGNGVTTYTTPAAMRTRGETATYHATFDDAMTGVASGDTVTMRLAISASAVTKSIPSGVTVNLVDSATSNALFDNVTFTGSGTVELKAFPSDATSRVDNSWTGTVVFPTAGDVQALDTKLNAWGNGNSKIQLHSVGTPGSKGQGEGTWSVGTVNPTIEILSGATVILNNGNNGAIGVFTTLSGAGTLQLDWNKSGTTYNQKINKLDGFTGTLKTEQNTQKFIIREIALAAPPSMVTRLSKWS